MKTVFQNPDYPECGAACLAMLADISLIDARKLLYGSKKPKRIGRRAILVALNEFGFIPKYSKAILIKNSNKLENVECNALVYGATLSLSRNKFEESKHWMVWDVESAVIRDPMGFSKPLRFTSYTEVKC